MATFVLMDGKWHEVKNGSCCAKSRKKDNGMIAISEDRKAHVFSIDSDSGSNCGMLSFFDDG